MHEVFIIVTTSLISGTAFFLQWALGFLLSIFKLQSYAIKTIYSDLCISVTLPISFVINQYKSYI